MYTTFKKRSTIKGPSATTRKALNTASTPATTSHFMLEHAKNDTPSVQQAINIENNAFSLAQQDMNWGNINPSNVRDGSAAQHPTLTEHHTTTFLPTAVAQLEDIAEEPSVLLATSVPQLLNHIENSQELRNKHPPKLPLVHQVIHAEEQIGLDKESNSGSNIIHADFQNKSK